MKSIIGKDVAIRLLKVMNVVMVAAFFAFSWYNYYQDYSQVSYYRKGAWLLIALYGLMYFSFCRSYDAFRVSINRISEIIYSQLLALVMTNGIMYLILWLLSLYMPNLIPILICFIAQMISCAIWVLFSHNLYYLTHQPRKSIVVFDCREGFEKLIDNYGMNKKFNVEKTIRVEEALDNLNGLDDYCTVFLSGVRSHDRNVIMKHCIEKCVELYVIPRVGDMILESATPIHMMHLPMLYVNRYKPAPEFLLFKRMFDIVVGIFFMIVFGPFMIITALAVKTDGGPALYKQTRLTKDGKEFSILKFRSMRVDAEKDGIARLSTGDKDDRITKVGRVIRTIRFDELPQIFNIIKGDMSIVGPRPERPEIAAQYEADMPEFRLRLQAKAGLTGYAQVYGKYNTTPYDKLLMDLMYIANPSIIEDIKICFATVKILFMKDSTEGVEDGKTTASK